LDCLAQVFIVAGRSVWRLANALQNPLAVFLDMNVGLAVLAERFAVWGDEGGYPVLNGQVWRDKADRPNVDSELHAFVLCEEILEGIFDGGTPFQTATVEFHKFAVFGLKAGQGSSVVFLKGINERLGVIKKGFFVAVDNRSPFPFASWSGYLRVGMLELRSRRNNRYRITIAREV
jgi:hypothetical protein